MSSGSPSSLTSSSCGDQVDIDSFINYDSTLYPSPSLSPSNNRGKAAVIQRPTIASSSSYTPQQTQSQTFSGPSHQYEQYKQQTGLPVGGLANTLAFNDMSYGMNSGTVMPGDSFFDVPNGLYDFNYMDGRSLSVGDGTDLDLDMDSPETEALPAYFYPTAKNEFIDPNAVGGQEEPSPPTSNARRVFPGMHQQAAQAKAAQQQKQQEMIRQQQQRQLAAQQAPPAQSRGNRAAAHPPTDPIVEERISRLLHQMRQNSAGEDDEASTPTNLPHIAKLKKEEEDMDEDERLLASEEGKKLSSKERRQLRNKVSARAFRSRRKEYIGQLEGEVAKHAQENNELKNQNRALMEENARLTELTRMLLSSPAFSGFMNELSVDQTQPQVQEQHAPQQTSLQPTRKDVNPHQVTQQQPRMRQQQIGLALMPDIDFSTLDLNGSWNSGMDMTFNNIQAFPVTGVPQGPAVDTGILSGKTSNFVPSYSSSEDSKDVPVVERAPKAQKVEETSVSTFCEDVEFDESDPAFALFSDAPASKETVTTPFEDLFGGVAPEKVFSRLEIVIDDESADQDVLAMERFERMLSSIDESFRRIGNITSHLQ